MQEDLPTFCSKKTKQSQPMEIQEEKEDGSFSSKAPRECVMPPIGGGDFGSGPTRYFKKGVAVPATGR